MIIAIILLTFALTITALLLGYFIGITSTSLQATDRAKDAIGKIFTRILPSSKEVGAVERPSAIDNFFRDNPERQKEEEEAEKDFEKVI